AVEVDGQDGPGARRDGLLDQGWVEVVGDRIDVHVDRRGADVADAPAGADPGVRRGDDLVAGADAAGAQGQVQGRGAVVEPDAVAHAEVTGEGALEPGDGRAEDEAPLGDDAVEGGLEFGADRVVLRGDVEEGDLGHAASCGKKRTMRAG